MCKDKEYIFKENEQAQLRSSKKEKDVWNYLKKFRNKKEVVKIILK